MLNRARNSAESEPAEADSSEGGGTRLGKRRHMKPVADARHSGSINSWLADGDASTSEPQPVAPIPQPAALHDPEPGAQELSVEREPTIEELLGRLGQDEFDVDEEGLERIEQLLGEALRRSGGSTQPRRRESSPDTVPTVEDLLSSVGAAGQSGKSSSDSSFRRVTDEVHEHAAALNAAAHAQDEAHQLLSLAKEERDRASAAAAKLIEEARQSAARLAEEAQTHADVMREQTRREAAERRASIETVATEFKEAAARDAERLRAEASVSAMEDARKAARMYVARAAALGVRDAERHRAEMAAILEASSQAAVATHATMKEFATTLADFMSAMDGHLAALESAVETARTQRDTVGVLLPINVDESTWAELGLGEVTESELVDLPVAFRDAASDESDDAESEDTDAPDAPDAVGADSDIPPAAPWPTRKSLYDGPTLA